MTLNSFFILLLLFLFIFFSLNFLRTKHCVRVSCLRIFSKKKKKIIRIILIKGRNIVRVEWIHILSYHTCIIRNRYLPQQVPLVSFSNLRLVHLCQAFHELTQILFSLSFGQLNPSHHHLQYYFLSIWARLAYIVLLYANLHIGIEVMRCHIPRVFMGRSGLNFRYSPIIGHAILNQQFSYWQGQHKEDVNVYFLKLFPSLFQLLFLHHFIIDFGTRSFSYLIHLMA